MRPPSTTARAPWVGLAVTVLVVALAFAVPPLLGWDVHARTPPPDRSLPPLHGWWRPQAFGPGTVPAVVVALLAVRFAVPLAQRLSWWALLATSYVAGLVWLFSLALVDGTEGLSRALGNRFEYLPTARAVTDVGTMLSGFVDQIPYAHPENWVIHVAGHPPGALLSFVWLDRLGLGGDLAAGVVVTCIAATTAPAVLVTLRALDAEDAARRVAPFLVLGPAAVFMAVSADAMFAAVAAWGLAALALAATRLTPGQMVAWAVPAGLLLGWCVMLSYGLPLLGFLAIAVLLAARSWWSLPIAAASAGGVVLGFAATGFVWWEAYPVLHERYWDGLAAARPASYWMWANLAALALSAGPLLGAGLARLAVLRSRADREVLLLVTGAAAAVVLADLSQMSKAEVERIWLPFVPWLLLSTAVLPERWHRWGLGLQLATALLLQHLLYTSW